MIFRMFQTGGRKALGRAVSLERIQWGMKLLKIGGGLLAQAARNQTQGVEERYTRGTAYAGRGKEGRFAFTVMAKTVGRTEPCWG